MQELTRSVIQGFPIGCVFALVAIGFVLTYKVSGVFNLAFGAQAYAAAAVYYVLRVKHGWPTPSAALVAVLIVSPLLGVLLYFAIYRHLRTAAPVARLAVSIGLLVALPEIVRLVLRLGTSPLYGVEGIVGNGDTRYKFFSYAVDRDQLATIIATLVLVVALTLLFRYTTIGLRMRAVVESARMTELEAISADRVSSVGWALSSILAGMAGVLLGPLFPQLSSQNFFVLIVTAIAAAAFAGLSSLPLALVGGLALGIGGQILSRTLPTNSILAQGLRPSLPFVVLFFVLILKPSLKRKREFSDPLAGVDPPPPALAAVERGPGLTRASHVLAVVVCIGAVCWFAFVGNAYWLSLATQAVIFSIVFLSITVFTGMAGEISLAQGSFAAIGAFACGQLATRWGVSVFVGVAVGIAIAAAVGALLAIPALRLGGIYLALATLAFALFFEEVIVKFDWAGGGILPVSVPRLILGPIDFTSDRAFFFLCLVALALTCLFVVRMRRGSTGLSLRALAGSEVAGSSVGISPARARITAFAVCAGIAATGGALLSMREGAANYQADFTVEFALFWLVLVVTLGPSTVEGAIVAAFALEFFPELLHALGVSPSWQYILFGLGAVAFARHPEGVFEHGKRMFLNHIQSRLDRSHTRREHKQPAASPRAASGEADSLELLVAQAPLAQDRGSERNVDDGGRHFATDGGLLELRHVRAGYGPFRAIFDVSLSVAEHSVVALLGANGAGKTTIARTVSGLVHLQAGSVLFDGTDIARLKAWEVARLGIVHAPEGRSVFGSLTVEENLTLAFARTVGRKRVAEGLEHAYELFPRLGERRCQDAATLSGGEQRMLSLARVLVHPPRLLVVDEPSFGLAPKLVDDLYTTLRHVHEAGTTLLIIEQHTNHALSIAHSVVLLRHGEVIYHGNVAECGDVSERLLANPSS